MTDILGALLPNPQKFLELQQIKNSNIYMVLNGDDSVIPKPLLIFEKFLYEHGMVTYAHLDDLEEYDDIIVKYIFAAL